MHQIAAWTSASSPPTLSDGALHLWWIEYAPPAEGAAEILSPDEHVRARRMRDGRPFVFFRSALRRVLAAYLATEPAAVVLDYGRHGKPRLREPDRALGFNLAHCADRGLLALMADAEIGVDLERLRPVPNDLRIARRQLGPDLASLLETLPAPERSSAFLRHWTAMEACIKVRGEGVFARSGRPCDPVNFVPRTGWMAAVAGSRPMPPPEEWTAFVFASRPGGPDHRQAPALPL